MFSRSMNLAIAAAALFAMPAMAVPGSAPMMLPIGPSAPKRKLARADRKRRQRSLAIVHRSHRRGNKLGRRLRRKAELGRAGAF